MCCSVGLAVGQCAGDSPRWKRSLTSLAGCQGWSWSNAELHTTHSYGHGRRAYAKTNLKPAWLLFALPGMNVLLRFLVARSFPLFGFLLVFHLLSTSLNVRDRSSVSHYLTTLYAFQQPHLHIHILYTQRILSSSSTIVYSFSLSRTTYCIMPPFSVVVAYA